MRKATARMISILLAFLVAFTSVDAPVMAAQITDAEVATDEGSINVSEELNIDDENIVENSEGDSTIPNAATIEKTEVSVAEETPLIIPANEQQEENNIITEKEASEEVYLPEEVIEVTAESLNDSDIPEDANVIYFDNINYSICYSVDYRNGRYYPIVLTGVVNAEDVDDSSWGSVIKNIYLDGEVVDNAPMGVEVLALYDESNNGNLVTGKKVLSIHAVIHSSKINDFTKQHEVVYKRKINDTWYVFKANVKFEEAANNAFDFDKEIYNVYAGQYCYLGDLYTTGANVSVSKIEFGNESGKYVSQSIVSQNSNSGSDTYKEYPRYKKFINDNEFYMADCGLSINNASAVSIAVDGVMPGTYNMRVTLSDGTIYEYKNSVKVAQPRQLTGADVFAQEVYYANDVYKFSGLDWNPCDGMTKLTFGLKKDAFGANFISYLFIDGEEEIFLGQDRTGYCSTVYSTSEETEYCFVQMKRKLTAGSHTFRLYLVNGSNPKLSAVYSGDFEVKPTNVTENKSFYSNLVNNTQTSISFSGALSLGSKEKITSASIRKNGSDESGITVGISYINHYSSNYPYSYNPEIKYDFEYDNIQYHVPFNSYDLSSYYHGTSVSGYLNVPLAGCTDGAYDVILKSNLGKYYTLKESFYITSNPVVQSVRADVRSGKYMCDPASGYIAVVVYGVNLEGKVPSFYFDEEMTQKAFSYDPEDENCAVSPQSYDGVIYKVKRLAPGEYGDALLYMKLDDENTLYYTGYYGSVEESYVKNSFVSFNYDENDDIVFPYFDAYTNKMLKLYLGEKLAEYAEDNNIGIASVMSYSYVSSKNTFYDTTHAETFEILEDSYGRYYVNIPITSDVYKTINANTFRDSVIKIGEKECNFSINSFEIISRSNLINPYQRLVVRETANMSNIILDIPAGGQGLTIAQINELATYPCVTIDAYDGEVYAGSSQAVFTSPVHDKITYVNDGVYQDTGNDSIVYKGNVISLKNPTKEFYTFGGWYTDAAFKTRAVTSIVGAGGKNVTLYAKWIPDEYKFVFKDGDDVMGSYSFKYGDIITINDSDLPFIKNGYSIDEFAIGDNDEILISRSELIGKAHDTANEAWQNILGVANSNNELLVKVNHWEEEIYNITYHLNGGTVNPNTRTKYSVKDGTLNLGEAELDYYDFDGWYRNADFTGEAVTTIDFSKESGDIHLYAKWKVAQNIKVTFEQPDLAAGGRVLKMTSSKSMPEIICSMGEIVTLPANIYSVAPINSTDRTKYIFCGWTLANGDEQTPDYSDKSKLTVSKSVLYVDSESHVTNEIVLKPVFHGTNETYEIKYYDSEEDAEPSKTEAYAFGSVKKLNSYIPKKTGYIFAGWKNKESGNIETVISARDYGAKEYEAQWKPKEYQVILNNNGGSGKVATVKVKYDEGFAFESVKNSFSKPGYLLVGWEVVGFTNLDETDREYKADPSDGGAIAYMETFGDLANGAKITFKAKWQPVEYTITYHSIEESGGTPNIRSSKYFYSTRAQNILTPDFTIDGMTFIGWYYDEACTKLAAKYNARSNTATIGAKVSGNLDLYAKWETSYMVRLHGAVGEEKLISGYKEGVKKALPANPFKSKNVDKKVFRGWSLASESTDYYCADRAVISPSVESNELKYDSALGSYVLDLYSLWEENSKSTYVVRFYGGLYDTVAGSMAEQKMVFGKPTAIAKNKFTRSDAVFDHWVDQYNNVYLPGEVINGVYTIDDGASSYPENGITLTACWKSSFKITFNDNPEASGVEHAYVYKYGTTMNTSVFAKLYTPVREGYTFAGWYLDPSCKKAFKGIAKTTSGDFTLYAKWTPKKYTVVFQSGVGGNLPIKGNTRSVTFTYGKATALPKCGYSLKGTKFAGWYSEELGVLQPGTKLTDINGHYPEGGTVTMTARWSPIAYKLTMIDRTTGITKTMDYGAYMNVSVEEPSMQGYVFGGWYRDANFRRPFAKNLYYETGNQTIYAKWTKVK